MVRLPSAIVSVLCLTATAGAVIPRYAGCSNSNYVGWDSIKYVFLFGDSYTSTSFNSSSTQPQPGSPLGNPSYPGFTSSNSSNWADFLTVKYNASEIFTYDMAYGGATVSSGLVPPFLPSVQSMAEQIENQFFPVYSSSPTFAPWTASNSLFGVWIGINDIGNTYNQGALVTDTLNTKILAVYKGLLEMLYNIGARNFLLLNVPPIDRSPRTAERGTSAQTLEAADIADFNDRINKMAKQLKEANGDVNIFTVDTNTLFGTVLDNPSSFPQTSIYRNTTEFCPLYESGTPANDTFIPACGIPVNQYFWLNGLHPTYPMHDVIAQSTADTMISGPNIC